LFNVLSTLANAQQNYDASLSQRIFTYASAVVRMKRLVLSKDLDMQLSVKKAITVLNKNGDDYAHIPYIR